MLNIGFLISNKKQVRSFLCLRFYTCYLLGNLLLFSYCLCTRQLLFQLGNIQEVFGYFFRIHKYNHHKWLYTCASLPFVYIIMFVVISVVSAVLFSLGYLLFSYVSFILVLWYSSIFCTSYPLNIDMKSNEPIKGRERTPQRQLMKFSMYTTHNFYMVATLLVGSTK